MRLFVPATALSLSIFFSAPAAAGPVLWAGPQDVEPLTFDDDPEDVEPLDGDSVGSSDALEAVVYGEAMVAALASLEADPFSVELLEATARQALADGHRDEATWYTALALEACGATGERYAPLLALRKEIGLPGPTPEALQAEYSRGLFDMARKCTKKGLYTNAVEMLQRCYGTTMQSRAEEAIARMLDREKAVLGLLESGIPIEIPSRNRVNKKKKRKVDRENTTWENFYEVKGKYYIVRSDMGYDFTHAFLDAMEQINAFYREVFGYKTRGGTMRSCRIDVYKSREEFDKYESGNRGSTISPSVRGFFVPGENRVATYDPRGEGGSLAGLWSTLFHEASHQFTHVVAPGLELAWLNEGTASYFEGALLQPGGSVATNRIPESRLRSLRALIQRGDPKLRDVITWYGGGSYEGEYYPFGWGLVYFFHNYENEKSERIFLPIYKDFLASYKSGGNHDIEGRFVEYFVKEAKVPGVESFEDFETMWKAWIIDLHDVHFGGTDQAEVLLERGTHQRGNKKLAYARESLRWALEKNPKHTAARKTLAEVLTEMKRHDEAVYQWRQIEQLARKTEDPDAELPFLPGPTAGEVRAEAQAALLNINEFLVTGLQDNLDRLIEDSLEASKLYLADSRPLSALHILEQTSRLVAGDPRLLDEIETIQADTGRSLKRGYRLPIRPDLEGWSDLEGWKGKAGTLSIHAEGLRQTVYTEAPHLPYRMECKIEIQDPGENHVAGLVFGSDFRGDISLVWMIGQSYITLSQVTDQDRSNKDVFPVPAEKGKEGPPSEIQLAIEVSEDQVIVYVGGKKVGKSKFGSEHYAGQVGVFAQNTGATFSDLRLVY